VYVTDVFVVVRHGTRQTRGSGMRDCRLLFLEILFSLLGAFQTRTECKEILHRWITLQEMSVDHFWRWSQCSYGYRTVTLGAIRPVGRWVCTILVSQPDKMKGESNKLLNCFIYFVAVFLYGELSIVEWRLIYDFDWLINGFIDWSIDWLIDWLTSFTDLWNCQSYALYTY